MRTFFSTHWKSIVAIVILVLLAVVTMTPGAADARPALDARLRAHVQAIGSGALERAARHIEGALAAEGYRVQRHAYRAGGQLVRTIEASLSNLAPQARPARIFIVGAHYDPAPAANDNGSGTAAVLELARLLKTLQPARGTELKFVFFVNEAPPWLMGGDSSNFIAFVGTLESSRLVRDALSAFRAASDVPVQGLAAPAYAQGVTLSDHAAGRRDGYPALMITDTAFLRYPYYHTAGDTEDRLDYEDMARVVAGLARTIAALAAGARI